jgi:hypothetical protein
MTLRPALALIFVAACISACQSSSGGNAGTSASDDCVPDLDAGVYHCASEGTIAACAPGTSDGVCAPDGGHCYTCQEGAGIECSCNAWSDAGTHWQCVGTERTCQ